MDPYSLMTMWNACRSNAMNKLLQTTFPLDQDGKYRSFFDILKKDNQDMIHPNDLIYIFAFAKQTGDDDLETV